MNLKPAILLLAVAISAQAQSFQNLDFEQANPVFIGNPLLDDVSAASALPYWSVYFGNVLQTVIWYNEISTGASTVSLLSAPIVSGLISPLDGNYSVILEAGAPGQPVVSMIQTGLIPSWAQSMLFEAEPLGPGPLKVLIGNQLVPTVPLQTEANYTVYGADLSAWAGQGETMTFMVSLR